MTKRRRPFCLPVAVLLLAASSAASAHHVAGGHVPTRWTHGLLSGLALLATLTPAGLRRRSR